MKYSTQLSVVIPTYQRGNVLLDTLALFQQQTLLPAKIIVVDQTHYEDADPVKLALQNLASSNGIEWVELSRPSIPGAMNVGLKTAGTDYVLFLDDDVEFDVDFICQHELAISTHQAIAHVGQIIQPWQQSSKKAQHINNFQPTNNIQSNFDFSRDLDFAFNGTEIAEIYNCMAGNLCVNRKLAIAAGGFDECFTGAAYRFETEFCRRFIKYAGKPFLFIPSATLNHLYIKKGGTRAWASSHLTSVSSVHSGGDYYFALRQGLSLSVVLYMLKRLLGSLCAKFYLRRPWWLPVRFIAELRGIFWAVRQVLKKPILIDIRRVSD